MGFYIPTLIMSAAIRVLCLSSCECSTLEPQILLGLNIIVLRKHAKPMKSPLWGEMFLFCSAERILITSLLINVETNAACVFGRCNVLFFENGSQDDDYSK